MAAMLRKALTCACCATALAYVLPAAPAAAAAARSGAVRMEVGVEVLPLMMTKQHSWMPKADDLAMANKKWYIVDAEGLRLGRMSSEIAKVRTPLPSPSSSPLTIHP